jgi:hypothetical protein
MIRRMFKYNHYIPILKAKDGEFGALSELPIEIKNKISPLIDVFDTESSTKSLDFRLDKIATKIKTAWGDSQPVFIDLFGIDLDKRVSGGLHPLLFIFERLRNLNVQAIPSIGFDRDEAYNRALRNIVNEDNRGVCIRLLKDDMDNTDELEYNLESLLGDLNIVLNDVHILLDFRTLKVADVGISVDVAIDVIRNLPNVNDWGMLTIAASGFPGSLSDIGTNATGTLPRTELQLWNSLIDRRREIERLPSFADYGIQHPDLLELNWNSISLVSNIRYTLTSEWLIMRGGSNKKYGWDQAHQLSRELIAMPEYYGASFCWGDSYITDCANETVGPGNMTTWRKVGTNHHLTLVASQIANARAS